MNARSAPFIQRFLSLKYGTPIAVLILILTLNSTLLLLSNLLQQSTSRLYHHGEGRSYMSVNVATQGHTGHEGDLSSNSPSSLFEAAVSALPSYSDNIAGQNQEEVLGALPVDIVYTWVNGSDPRHAAGTASIFLFRVNLFSSITVPF